MLTVIANVTMFKPTEVFAELQILLGEKENYSQ